MSVIDEVLQERARQDKKWGVQSHPDGTGGDKLVETAMVDRELCNAAAQAGEVTWRHILQEEVSEAFAETDPGKLSVELVQVAAVAVQWVDAIRRRLDIADPCAAMDAALAVSIRHPTERAYRAGYVEGCRYGQSSAGQQGLGVSGDEMFVSVSWESFRDDVQQWEFVSYGAIPTLTSPPADAERIGGLESRLEGPVSLLQLVSDALGGGGEPYTNLDLVALASDRDADGAILERVHAALRGELVESNTVEAEVAAVVADRDSWRRVSERLEAEKQDIEATLAAEQGKQNTFEWAGEGPWVIVAKLEDGPSRMVRYDTEAEARAVFARYGLQWTGVWLVRIVDSTDGGPAGNESLWVDLNAERRGSALRVMMDLEAELAEARATLAAEQGRAEGALPGWNVAPMNHMPFFRWTKGDFSIMRSYSGWDLSKLLMPAGVFPTARNAMRAADVAAGEVSDGKA